MFGFLRQDPRKKLRKAYDAKLEAAMTAQRNGDIRTYSTLSQEADALWRELEAMDKVG
ncbi:DUF6435 family protein [Halopseudomonas salegens]|uniref:Lacal_2735 family protein n=1 Tax=Halopseudomonas salegens TaxID=1434072 RepID=A0A1H2H3N4_9GAMM|nr:DUF6435 family protein [Halopseudomonas salegens]SDU26432.1 hypothetical protein SAMN05216210_2748 [Halopseudomonas salegens]